MRNLVICFITCLMVYSIKAQSWSIQASGTTETLLSVFAPTEDICYAVGTEGTILKTDNGGGTWVTQSSGTTMDLHSVFFTDISNGYAAGEFGTILKTINGGATWVPVPSGLPGCWLESIFFIDANIGFVAGRDNWSEEGYILKTIDGGINWITTEVVNPLLINLNPKVQQWTSLAQDSSLLLCYDINASRIHSF